MTYSGTIRHERRAPRVNLRGTVSAAILLENGRYLPAKVQQLSSTGGLLELSMYIEERAPVVLTLPIGSSILRPKAEMMFPMWGVHGYLQPFRFADLRAQDRQTLEMEIEELLKQTVARATGHGSGLRPPSFYLESF